VPVREILPRQERCSDEVQGQPAHKLVYGVVIPEEAPMFHLPKGHLVKGAGPCVSRQQVTRFFENFMVSVEGAPPENILTFDKTNLTDKPGDKEYTFKKGTKYCEKVQNTSIMILARKEADCAAHGGLQCTKPLHFIV
jgi:hypothetical protein